MRKHLHGLAEAHVVGEHATETEPRQELQPCETAPLIVAQFAVEVGRLDGLDERIVGETEEWAARFIKAMKSEGSAEKVVEIIGRRPDHNSAPERSPMNPRANYTADKAPHGKKDGGNYED